MATRTLPDITYIRECVDYDPATGVFVWRERPSNHFPHPKAHKWWNCKFAGKIAGSGSSDRNNQRRLCFSHIRIKAHRAAWMLIHGKPVPDILDHIDGDPTNNRIANLRPATHTQNVANSKGRNGKSGVKGVSIRTRGRSTRFLAHIGSGNSYRALGYFATLEEAAKTRREAAEYLYGDYARHD
jgi:hypothetical protein